MQEEIIQGNKAIAEFMGLITDEFDGKLIASYDNGKSWFGKLYNDSWEMLMPVVEKITDKVTGCIVVQEQGSGYNKCTIGNNNISMKSIEVINEDSPLTCTWKTVVQFISWYNNQIK